MNPRFCVILGPLNAACIVAGLAFAANGHVLGAFFASTILTLGIIVLHNHYHHEHEEDE